LIDSSGTARYRTRILFFIVYVFYNGNRFGSAGPETFKDSLNEFRWGQDIRRNSSRSTWSFNRIIRAHVASSFPETSLAVG
jgi:hypothetical protein